MQRDSSLAHKNVIHPSNITDQLFLVSCPSIVDNQLSDWLRRNIYQNPIVATYKLILMLPLWFKKDWGMFYV